MPPAMARNIFATDAVRTMPGFLETTPQLVAAVGACSVDIATVTQLLVPGSSKSAMLHKRRQCDQARAEEAAQQLGQAVFERDEAVAERNCAEEACLPAEAEREAEQYEREEAQNECGIAEEARDQALKGKGYGREQGVNRKVRGSEQAVNRQ